MTRLKCEIDAGPPAVVRCSRDYWAIVALLSFASVLFAGFAFASILSSWVSYVPAAAAAIGALLALNVRIDILIDSSDQRVFVTRRGLLRDARKTWYPFSTDSLRVERRWCSDRYNYCRNYFVVLILPDDELPIFQDPKNLRLNNDYPKSLRQSGSSELTSVLAPA